MNLLKLIIRKLTGKQDKGCLLSYNRLHKLIDEGVITADHSNVNATSIDLTLGGIIFTEMYDENNIVDLVNGESPKLNRIDLIVSGYVMPPACFVLGSTIEKFNLPNTISAEYKLNSSLARSALDHLNAGWCDAGWNNSTLTLELKNCLRFQSLRLRPGMKIGQIVFFEHEEVPVEGSYATKGQYNGDDGVTENKGLRLGDQYDKL